MSSSMKGLSEPTAPSLCFTAHQGDSAVFNIRVHGRSGGPRLLLSHGNGFAIDGYWPFWRHLCERYEVVVFDFRNHGQSQTGSPVGHDWPTFTHDFDQVLKACTERLGRRPTAGIFHSMSSVTSVLHWTETAFPWAALVLFEPPILPPDSHPLHNEAFTSELAIRDWALTRQAETTSPQAFASDMKKKRAFSGWEDDTYLLMAKSILTPTPDAGKWQLRCAPELEAKVYNENRHSHLWHKIRTMPFPVLIYSGDPERSSGPVTAKVSVALARENAKSLHIQPGGLHFPMLQDDRGAAEVVKHFLQQSGF